MAAEPRLEHAVNIWDFFLTSQAEVHGFEAAGPTVTSQINIIRHFQRLEFRQMEKARLLALT
jgi:hypothetical protein